MGRELRKHQRRLALAVGLSIALACGDTRSPGDVVEVVGFHGGRSKLGWVDTEPSLTPHAVERFGLRWSSSPFERFGAYAAHAYASPLFVDDLRIGHDDVAALIVATSNADVYALAARPAALETGDVAPGAVLWKTRLGEPSPVPKLDGGVPLGVLSTPVLDRTHGVLYVASLDRAAGWEVFALDASTGAVRPGWPVRLDDASLGAVNRNGPAKFQEAREMSQRGALALSPRGDRLYVGFGSFIFASVGWLAAIDTAAARIAAAFSSAPFTGFQSNGGIWGSGGPAVAADGEVFVSTGNSPGTENVARTWGNSVLRFGPDLDLRGAYSPFNYCKLDTYNIDLAGSAPILLPSIEGARDRRLIAFGGKQGNVYLADIASLVDPGDRRAPCTTDASKDRSLLPPEIQPQFGTRGPLNVFGPYSDELGELDFAKMRSRPAFFRDEAGSAYLFVSGQTKAFLGSSENVPPGVARLRIVTDEGSPFLRVDGYADEVRFVNPGSPVVTSDHGRDPIVWVVDENATRVASLLDPKTHGPILRAIDGRTLRVLFRSDELTVGGKYVTPAIAHGTVYVVTDRVWAFGENP